MEPNKSKGIEGIVKHVDELDSNKYEVDYLTSNHIYIREKKGQRHGIYEKDENGALKELIRYR